MVRPNDDDAARDVFRRSLSADASPRLGEKESLDRLANGTKTKTNGGDKETVARIERMDRLRAERGIYWRAK